MKVFQDFDANGGRWLKVTIGFAELLLAAVLAAVLFFAVTHAQSPDVTLSGTKDGLQLSFPAGQAWECITWTSEADPTYRPTKCGPLTPERTAVVEDWSMVNCNMSGPAYCPDDQYWLVRGFVQADTPNGQDPEPVYSNTLRIRFTK